MLYHEIKHGFKSRHKGWIEPGVYSAEETVVTNIATSWITLHAERVWAEHNGKVRWVKNRQLGHVEDPPDLKEFAWIKLQAQAF